MSDSNKIGNRPIMSEKKQANILHFFSKTIDRITNIENQVIKNGKRFTILFNST